MQVNLIEELSNSGMDQLINFYEECRRLSNMQPSNRSVSNILIAYFDSEHNLIFNAKNTTKKNVMSFKLDYKNKTLSLEKLNSSDFITMSKPRRGQFVRPLLLFKYYELHNLTERMTEAINKASSLIGI